MWGHFESLGRGAHAHKHKPPRTLPISSGLLCSCDRRDAYYIFVCVFVCTCGKTNTIAFGELLTVLVLLTSIVKCQHSVFIAVIYVFRV